jgi:polyhydroxyalkanoate synthesis regulator protein
MSPSGLTGYEEQIRQNLALFDRAMKMFSPFPFNTAESETPPAPAAAAPAEPPKDEIAELQKQVAAMQEQLAALAKK